VCSGRCVACLVSCFLSSFTYANVEEQIQRTRRHNSSYSRGRTTPLLLELLERGREKQDRLRVRSCSPPLLSLVRSPPHPSAAPPPSSSPPPGSLEPHRPHSTRLHTPQGIRARERGPLLLSLTAISKFQNY